MSSLKKFDYRIKDNRKRNIFLCGIILVVVTIVGVKLFNSYASFSNETNELTMVNAKTKVYPTAVAKITELEKTNTNSELRYDGTTDNNLRYIGKNPHNYVDFGDGTYDNDLYYGFGIGSYNTKEFTSLESCQNDSQYNNCMKIHSQGDKILWRIIGVMNDVEDANSVKVSRVKLINADGIAQISWDRRCDELSIDWLGHCAQWPEDNNNNWTESRLQKLLNTAYLNSTKSDEYNRISWYIKGFSDINRRYEKIDFTNKGIKSEYREMIDTVKYKLGGPDSNSSNEENYIGNLTPSLFYSIEQSDNVYLDNPKEWIGKIGLMYPSDYGYATSGGNGIETENERKYVHTLEICMNTPIYKWSINGEGCRDNDWLYLGEKAYQWTVTSFSDNNSTVVELEDGGGIAKNDVYRTFLVRPVLYLKPTVKITGGNGTEDNPFTLSE